MKTKEEQGNCPNYNHWPWSSEIIQVWKYYICWTCLETASSFRANTTKVFLHILGQHTHTHININIKIHRFSILDFHFDYLIISLRRDAVIFLKAQVVGKGQTGRWVCSIAEHTKTAWRVCRESQGCWRTDPRSRPLLPRTSVLPSPAKTPLRLVGLSSYHHWQ